MTIQKQIKNIFATFVVLIISLCLLSVLILNNFKVGSSIRAIAIPNCPVNYNWNGTQCEQFVSKDAVYSCPSGSSVDTTNCKTTVLDKVGLQHLVYLTPNTQGPDFNTCPAGTGTLSTIRTIGLNYIADGSGASVTWNYKVCIATIIFNYIKVISGSSINASSPCTSSLINIGITSNAVPTNSSIYALCIASNNSSTIVLGNGSCPNGFTDRGSTPNANLCISNTDLFSFPATLTSSCPSNYTDLVNGTSTPCVAYAAPLSFSCPPRPVPQQSINRLMRHMPRG